MKYIQYFDIKKITSFLIISFFLLLAFGSSDDDEDESDNTDVENVEISLPLPPEQVSFSALIDSMYNVYKEQPNDLKKSAVKKARNSLFKGMKFERKVTNWIGELQTMSTNSKGNASIDIDLINSRADVQTANYPIMLGSNLYEAVSSLSTGDTVVISGRFLQSPDYMGKYDFDYLYESSFTESGSMSSPDFYFKFKSVEKFVPSSGEAVPEIQ